MKTKLVQGSIALYLLVLLNSPLATVFAQGTAFTYQGRLNDTNGPANGTYDLTFTLYAAGGAVLTGPVTNAAVAVSAGLFTTTIDFGAGYFTGTDRWLEIGVRTNGGGTFVTLTPRQQLTPAPYAIFANTASNLSGAISLLQLPAAVVTNNNIANITLKGSFTGNGGGLTNLNASQLTTGTVSDARLSANVALLNGIQNFTGSNTFFTGTGSGRLTVSGFGGIDTNLFTGLGLQYYASSGESAILSSYNDGFGFLSFYTKAGPGAPLAKQMIIDRFGGVAIDQQGVNNGVLNNGTVSGAGLSFGLNSGEGIASKRTAGGNNSGLDFYTSYNPRLSIANSGYVGIGRQSPITGADVFDVLSPATAGSYGGMYLDTVGTNALPFYGYAINGLAYAWTYEDGSDANKWKLYNGGYWLTVDRSGQVGINTTTPTAAKLEINGDVRIDNHELFLTPTSNTNNGSGLGYRTGMPGISGDGPFLYGYNGGALGGLSPTTIALSWDYHGNIWVSNNCSVATLSIRGGADLAEPFNITSGDGEVPEGAVVVIDEQNPGHLKLSDSPYDTHVAGVVSGANGINPGIQMHQQGLIEGGKNVALTGRVYVQADASNGAIRPGDMLTTSSTPGHAMKVNDHARAAGAVLGKAMTALKEGKGMVLVLVTLQ